MCAILSGQRLDTIVVAEIVSPLQGTVVRVEVGPGDAVRPGQSVVIIESMKMEHPVAADAAGAVTALRTSVGSTVRPGDVLLTVEEGVVAAMAHESGVEDDQARPDLAEVVERHGFGLDVNRPEAVERRRRTGQRTTRENVADLCDDGSFVEYGPLAIAAQRRRRAVDDLMRRTPADGLVAGVGRVDGHQTVVMSYDYTVLAGTQGLQNHRKKDRLFDLAERMRLPVVFFTEGGGAGPATPTAAGSRGSTAWPSTCSPG
jgi:hypothetical protein